MSQLQRNLKQLQDYAANLEQAKKSVVAVGLPSEKVGATIYGDGLSVIRVGAFHEYGEGNNPPRSFLRVPFGIKSDAINDFIGRQFAGVFNGETSDKALNRVGLFARNISVDAFSNGGYGTWPDITQATKTAKGSSKILTDNGILKGAITWAVRS